MYKACRRILREAAELTNHPTPDIHAAPLSDASLFEWHFTIRGPPAPSPFSAGVYHGRISLPPTYPLRPPSFRFLTPSGRFEVNREICLSISGHHEETWQPAWGIRTALTAIRAFMDSAVEGQVGGLECSAEGRRTLAEGSKAWTCRECAGGRTNEGILEDERVRWQEMGGVQNAEEDKVPDELRLTFRDQLKPEGSAAEASVASPPTPSSSSPSQPQPQSQTPQPQPTRTIPAAIPHHHQHQQVNPPPPPPAPQPTTNLDRAIFALLFILLGLIWRRLGKEDEVEYYRSNY
ncbi:ubiquitin conjugating enzyme [Peziza echinospora]|nr:ubiquitin conjugating enzyme [Peziza echinospora]